MSIEIDNLAGTARTLGTLPDGMVLVESAVATLRAWLEANDLAHWSIYHADLSLPDIERHGGDHDAPGEWHELPALSGGGAMHRLDYIDDQHRHAPAGVLLFRHAEVCIARWHWIWAHHHGRQWMLLVATPDPRLLDQLLEKVRARQHAANNATWQILRGSYVDDTQPPRRPIDRGSLFLTTELAQRVDREIIGFFDDRAASLYRSMGVPYRRGVLLHGPPGNGKTSTIRYIGGQLPAVSALILRPSAGFDADDLEEAIAIWTRQAPSMLVIEDLNWLFERVEVSRFLNLLDGIDTPGAKGLLLIASTNHPDRLDPAINNRPGRFDVVVEMGLPCASMRRRYLEHLLGAMGDAVLDELAERSNGLSFAHLGEVARIAGLTAIHDGRTVRTADDVCGALELVKAANDSADRGFTALLPNFGLQHHCRSKPALAENSA